MSTVIHMLDRNLLSEETWDELAARGELSPDRLDLIRSTDAEPSVYELGEIAAVLNINPSYLIRPEPAVVARRDSGVDHADMSVLLRRFDQHVAAFRSELDQPDPIPGAFPAGSPWAAEKSGSLWAGRHGLTWELDRPDLLAEVIEEHLRIPVLVWPIPGAPFGATLRLSSTTAIWINSTNLPGSQQRFTLAHELGHVLLRHGDIHRIESAVDWTAADDVENPERQEEERHAMAFARGLLAPYHTVRAAWDGGQTAQSVAHVAATLGISFEAAAVALQRNVGKQVEGTFTDVEANPTVGAVMADIGHRDFYDWAEDCRNRRRLPGVLDEQELLERALDAVAD